MKQSSSQATCPADSRLGAVVSAVSLTLLLSVLGGVLFLSLRSPLKDDIAWLLYAASRWMAGRELYIDVVEVNPPLIIWISAIPLRIAGWLDIDPQFVVMPMFIAFVLSSAAWSAHLLGRRGGMFARTLPVFAAIGTALLLLPAVDLGQREHLLIAALLPYLVLFAQSLDQNKSPDHNKSLVHSKSPDHNKSFDRDKSPDHNTSQHPDESRGRQIPPVTAAIVAGILAGLGCALKPRYAAVFVVLEVLALSRGMRPWRLLPLTAGATLLAYAALVAALIPAYLQRAVPMALALYGATDTSFPTLLWDSSTLLAGQAVAIALLWLRRGRPADHDLMLTLLIVAATSTVVCFMDGKDWYYHRLPAIITAVLALLAWTAAELTRRRPVGAPLLAAFATLAVFCAASIQRLEPEAIEAVARTPTTVDRLERILRTEHARTYIAFSEWIALGFPVVNETGVSWASRFDSMWALRGEVWRARFDPTADRQWPIARWVAHDFIAGCPDIAVVDTREPTKYISVLSSADPAFARAWSRYRPLAAFDGLIVYKRGKAGCMDVWVAAEASPRTANRTRPRTDLR